MLFLYPIGLYEQSYYKSGYLLYSMIIYGQLSFNLNPTIDAVAALSLIKVYRTAVRSTFGLVAGKCCVRHLPLQYKTSR